MIVLMMIDNDKDNNDDYYNNVDYYNDNSNNDKWMLI